MSTITMIKKDALINISIGAGLVSKIQKVISSIVSEQTDEELENFKKMISENSTEYPEDWMDNVLSLTYLLQTIESEAVKQGFTYEKDITQPEN
jgi:hypothetical protein